MSIITKITALFSRRKRKRRKILTFRQYSLLYGCASAQERLEQFQAVKHLPRPLAVCGKEVPKNLNLLTYGQLSDIRDAGDSDDTIVNCCHVVLEVSAEEVLAERAERILWLAWFCNTEITRINKLLSSVKPKFSLEERQAGVEKLNFGTFGVLDWYARRMGIADQNEVRQVPWIRIYACMKNDNALHEYNRRLREIYKRKPRRKK